MKEIERKFLVESEEYKHQSFKSKHMVQGYLSRDVDATVRVRIVDDSAVITIKSRNRSMTRDEWEYNIPVEDAQAMLEKCCKGTVIEKTRYLINYGNHVWEVDEFKNPAGVSTVAEIELKSEDEQFQIPEFVGEEVTGDPKYYNSNI